MADFTVQQIRDWFDKNPGPDIVRITSLNGSFKSQSNSSASHWIWKDKQKEKKEEVS